jgi:hypothetical protein
MRQCVYQGRTTGHSVSPTTRHLLWWNQDGFFGMPRLIDGGTLRARTYINPTSRPIRLQRMNTGYLILRKPCEQTIRQTLRQWI